MYSVLFPMSNTVQRVDVPVLFDFWAKHMHYKWSNYVLNAVWNVTYLAKFILLSQYDEIECSINHELSCVIINIYYSNFMHHCHYRFHHPLLSGQVQTLPYSRFIGVPIRSRNLSQNENVGDRRKKEKLRIF